MDCGKLWGIKKRWPGFPVTVLECGHQIRQIGSDSLDDRRDEKSQFFNAVPDAFGQPGKEPAHAPQHLFRLAEFKILQIRHRDPPFFLKKQAGGKRSQPVI